MQMKSAYNVWIVMTFQANCEGDIIGVCFNRITADKLLAEAKQLNPSQRYVIRAANAYDHE